MDIPALKRHLAIIDVAKALGIKVGKQDKANCPFHDDKTPSLQFSREKNIATCFSSRCDAGTMDIIDLVEKKQGYTKAQAIDWLRELAGHPTTSSAQSDKPEATSSSVSEATEPAPLDKIAVLTKAWRYFQTGMRCSKPAKTYARERMLNIDELEQRGIPMGYHNGKFHQKENKHFIESCIKYGLMRSFAHGGYKQFAAQSLVFALRNEQQQITGFYFRSIKEKGEANKHLYLKERQGLYPHYPKPDIQYLILTESVVDAATLLQHTDFPVLALYGTNGLTKEHRQAIGKLKDLREIILFLDGDASGRAATKKYAEELSGLPQGPTVSYVETPDNEDINSLAQSHEPTIFAYLLQQRRVWQAGNKPDSLSQAVPFLESSSFTNSTAPLSPSEEKKPGVQRPLGDSPGVDSPQELPRVDAPSTQEHKPSPPVAGRLITDNPDLLIYQTSELRFTLLGGIHMKQLDRLRVTLKTQPGNHRFSYRQSLDLYRDDQVERYVRKASEKLEMSSSLLVQAISELTDALEQHRLQHLEQQKTRKPDKRVLTEARQQAAITYLKTPDLLTRTNADLGRSGIVGEEVNRLILWLAFTSRLRQRPLHVICLGASGTGKTYLQERVSELIPDEDKLSITMLSENALYYFGQQELSHKLILLEDLDGASDEKILYAIRELQTKRSISKSVVLKDSRGQLRTVSMQVDGPISLAGTTTQERLYEDNANRCLLIYLDGSAEQQRAVMAYQRKESAGTVNVHQQSELKALLQDVQSVLKPITVRNPYAEQLQLPPEVFKPLRTQEHYLLFIETVTFYHQYQREIKTDIQTGEHYIETTLEDIQVANSLLKEVLLAKSDELSGACRKFLEQLKSYVSNQNQPSFYAKAVRKTFRMSPPTVKRHLYQLVQYGYVKVTGGSKHRGYEYEVVDGQEYEQLQQQISNALDEAYGRLSGSTVAQ